MNLIPFSMRKLNCSILAIFCWASAYGVAFAAEGGESGGGSYGASVWVLPYALVILCIGLGMFVVCRSARRKDRAKPESYEKISLIDRGDADEAVAEEKRHGVQRTKRECKEAKSAMIMSIVGLIICAPLCIFSLIQGLKARKMIAGDRRLSGDGQALAAVVISAIGIANGVLWIFIAIAVMMSGGASSAPSIPDEPPAAEAPEEPEG